MVYSAAFRRRLVQRMTGSSAMSATALAEEVGVPQPTLTGWLREASIVGGGREEADQGAGARTEADEGRARLGELAFGDVVRFSACLAIVGDIPRGESSVTRWRFEDVPANEVEVVARGTRCPH